ncbi:MAG TPA: long-chain N-acyl amino acid synthase [Burkholderiales bacterium]|nr:long-chain N-acyl amino acid synthase [Burkholderiales bacterium]
MKERLLKLFGKPGRHKADSAATARHEAADAGAGRSGETVFAAETVDRGLRFRSLTLPEAEQPSIRLEAPTQPAFKIRVARTTGFRRAAGGLVGRRYGDRGYLIPNTPSEPDLYSFLAYDEGQIVGTVSIRLDSSRGLSADDLYHEELEALRRSGWKICEFTRLAVDVKTASKPVLAGLFHTAYLYAARIRGYDYAVIEVNPRHVAFYRRALGFEPIGPERMNRRVDAPAVLLCVAFDTIAKGVAEYGGQAERATQVRSLFPFGFGPDEEAGILQRLRELDATRNGPPK